MEEIALEKKRTCNFLPFPIGNKVVSSKWLFMVKQDPNGKIERYTARLVAKGYSQAY